MDNEEQNPEEVLLYALAKISSFSRRYEITKWEASRARRFELLMLLLESYLAPRI